MSDQQIGWGALLSGGNAVRSVALAGGVALHAINVYVATTILPSVVRDIGGLDYYAWNTTLFVIASIIGAALATRLLISAGPRLAYVVAALIFALGTLLCAIAPSMPFMLAGRIVQGGGGGVLLALSYAMIRLVFPEHLWPRAMALVSGMWGIATLVGPAIGGIFAELDAWRAAFWSVVPAALLFAAMAWQALPAQSPETSQPTRLPLAQLGLLTLAVLIISFASTQTTLVWNLGGVAVAFVLIAVIGDIDGSAKTRLLPRGGMSLASPLGQVFAAMSALAITVTSSEIFVPLFLQVLHGQQPLIAGYLAAAMAAGWTAGSITGSGVALSRVPRLITLAPVLALAGMIALTLLIPPGSGGEIVLLGPITVALFLVGFGVGLGWPHLLTRVLQLAPKDEEDLASASITTVQLSAAAIGAALAGVVVNLAGLTEPGGVEGTARAALWLFGIFAAVPVLGLVLAQRVAQNMRR
ncbi:MFS transporter [Paracoccus aminophilus]|uniref:Major facilitator transporter n=1 Tax=Paracoccus aminophilus JCM 7686 TaxID=1367847 RepID=S5XR62_PARAH|nr:MFS transporter [Paracoccus aminophilus]AGT09899.1 major facilitator transporter [Paracoccus aminophilus JCM 7686]